MMKITDERLVKLRGTVVRRLFLGIIIAGAIFFGSAGELAYWEAWVYLAIIFGPMALVGSYFLRRDPEMLERRMRVREKESRQKLVVGLSNLLFFLGFILPGIDHRLNGSAVPAGLVLMADLVVLAGYVIFFLVIRENSYASRVVEVEEGQKVISTGPYAIVRHPMYAGAALMFVATPIALGSYWGLIAFVPMALLLVPRILNEEQVLTRQLPLYKEYTERTRYRLVPYIW